MSIDTKALRELFAVVARDPDDMDAITDLSIASLDALPALLDAADRLAAIERLADTGTAQSFAALSDDDKLRWFVTTGQRDREQTERIKELEASLATIQATKDFDLDRWLDWQDEKERMLADLSEAQRMGLESVTEALRLEAELAHIRTDRDAAAEACRMLHADKTKLEAENQRLREALDAISQYGSDTLSGRADGGADDRAWQRAAVLEMTRRADAALSQPAAEQPAGDWHCPNCGYIDAQRVTIEGACDACRQPVEWDEARTDVIGQNGNDGGHYADADHESLPLMARRDYMPAWANFAAWDGDGRCWLYSEKPNDINDPNYNKWTMANAGSNIWAAAELDHKYAGDWRDSLHRITAAPAKKV